jgi:hypothetical protein
VCDTYEEIEQDYPKLVKYFSKSSNVLKEYRRNLKVINKIVSSFSGESSEFTGGVVVNQEPPRDEIEIGDEGSDVD